MASLDNPLVQNEKIIWTSTSYGRDNASHLFATTYDRSPNVSAGQVVDTTQLDYNIYPFPPGLNDLHFENNKDTLWTLTEFGSNEGTNNNRLVFALAKGDIMPPAPSVGINNEKSFNKVNIYPNPAENSFIIDLGEENQAFVTIYNSVGELILTKHVQQKTSSFEGLKTSGYYTVEIHFEDKIVRKKLLIK
ncbi:MAG TPA: T9SS type A sorting domain-containing protein [Brumimicrobium sp.]|nr:T9SS type A sorting domain-containing protein [Brumimicrobium sp.]